MCFTVDTYLIYYSSRYVKCYGTVMIVLVYLINLMNCLRRFMPAHTEILYSVIALVAWTLLLWVWMYATRIPAIKKANMKLDPESVNGVLMSQLPANVRWKADNYTHLMEQPTIFYALVFAITLLGYGNGINCWFAWAYVFFRVIHSLVQVLINIIELRFVIFVLSTLCLFAMLVNTSLKIWIL